MRESEMTCKSVQRAVCSGFIPELTPAENEHLAACGICTELLLTHMLQQKPDISIPTEWAARVASRIAAETKTGRLRRPRPAYGFSTAVAMLMMMALGWSVLAYVHPQWWTLPGEFSLVVEGIVTFEISAIALWLGIRRSAG